MKIKVNGNYLEVEDNITLSRLIENLKLNSKKIVIELNRKIIDEKDYILTEIKDGDTVEIVHFVGGG
ncbi:MULTISPECIES: sulfur carrier protein ThiS [Calditerrivibrio]|jgi:sulfur carrier protein|uniref:sulfur carrier protein ThiS n=1 Tax=Calditerrivibrio TaxID=545865 RepID=UPI003C7544A2